MGSVRFSTGQHVAFRSAFSKGVHGEVNGLLRRLNGSWPGRVVRGTKNGGVGALEPSNWEQRNREQGTGNRAQKVSKNLVLYRLGPIGFNPIGGANRRLSFSGLCGLLLGKCNRCNRHADRVVLKNTDTPGFDG